MATSQGACDSGAVTAATGSTESPPSVYLSATVACSDLLIHSAGSCRPTHPREGPTTHFLQHREHKTSTPSSTSCDHRVNSPPLPTSLHGSFRPKASDTVSEAHEAVSSLHLLPSTLVTQASSLLLVARPCLDLGLCKAESPTLGAFAQLSPLPRGLCTPCPRPLGPLHCTVPSPRHSLQSEVLCDAA